MTFRAQCSLAGRGGPNRAAPRFIHVLNVSIIMQDAGISLWGGCVSLTAVLLCVCFPFQISDKTSQERDRGGCGVVGGGSSCSSVGGAGGGERSVDRPRTSPSQRLMSTHHHHHHLGYSLLPAQYNLPYAAGKPVCLPPSFVPHVPPWPQEYLHQLSLQKF